VQGSCELPQAVRGMPGSEFEPRSPLQKETPSIRMGFLFTMKVSCSQNSLPPPMHEVHFKFEVRAGFLRIAAGGSRDAGKRVRAS